MKSTQFLFQSKEALLRENGMFGKLCSEEENEESHHESAIVEHVVYEEDNSKEKLCPDSTERKRLRKLYLYDFNMNEITDTLRIDTTKIEFSFTNAQAKPINRKSEVPLARCVHWISLIYEKLSTNEKMKSECNIESVQGSI